MIGSKSIGISLFVFSLNVAAAAPADEAGAALGLARPIMHCMVKPVLGIYPLLAKGKLSQEDFSSAKVELGRIEREIRLLRSVSPKLGEDYSKVAMSMLDDVAAAKKFAGQGHADKFKFSLTSILHHCGACHSKTDGRGDFGEFSKLLATESSGLNEWRSQVDMMLNLRQFETARKALAEKMLDQDVSLNRLDIYDIYFDYLHTAMNGKDDYSEITALLDQYSQVRKDMPDYHRDALTQWVKSLNALKSRADVSRLPLDKAVKLVDDGMRFREQDFSEAGMVDVIAGGLRLQELSLASNPDSKQRAEAYRYLGRIAERYFDTFWFLQSRDYYVSAIESLPHSEIAQAAFRDYEEELIFEYTGSAGTVVPMEEQTKLHRLRALAF